MYDNFALYVHNVDKSYGNKEILQKFCMTVEKGTIYGLLGASGCGKTTILTGVVGRTKIDRGEIWILGEKSGGVPGRKVGYMPQNTALVEQFTVKDAVFYFGRIFEMKEKLIIERYHKLHAFLDLPPHGRYIRNCSGGEQRRVSLAAALIHKPKLLILDEPSVGADPLIRDRIWNHFVEITAQDKTTVIITTHYIEEARQADKIGLMRGGKLLVEDSPNKLMNHFQAETLEDVFLTLSVKQEHELENTNWKELTNDQNNILLRECSTSNVNATEMNDGDYAPEKEVISKETRKESHKSFSLNRMRALLDKNFKQVYRNPLSSMFLLLTPLTQSLLFLLAVGGDLRNIPLGIVNDENVTYPCSSSISVTNESIAHFSDLSCRFLDYLDIGMIDRKYYDSVTEGIDDIRGGRLIGVLHIFENFTESLENQLNNRFNLDDSPFISAVWMDMSEYPKGNAIRSSIQELYLAFQESVYVESGHLGAASRSPITVQEYIYGNPDDQFIIFMTPAIILMLVFFFGLMMTSSIVVTEKCDGIWDRSIVAGVTSLELTLSHFLLQAALLIIMVVETMVAPFAVFKQEYLGSLYIIFLIIYFQGICGLICGFWVSAVSTDHTMAHIIISGFSNTTTILSGFFWPIQAMPTALRIFAKCLPFTLPIESLRNVIKRGWGLDHPQVLNGVGVMAAWILGLGLLCIVIVKTRR